MTSVVRLTCLAAMAALALGACTPKSSGNAGPSFVDSGARPRPDGGNDAGAPDTPVTDTGASPDTTSDAATPDAPTDTPVGDAPASDAAPADADARDSAGDPTLNLDLPAVDVRDALPTDLGADARDGGADARDGGG